MNQRSSTVESSQASNQSIPRTMSSIDNDVQPTIIHRSTSTIRPNHRQENEEEDELMDAIEKLIFDFLSQPGRRQPFRTFVRWSVIPDTIPSYRVLIRVCQDPPS